MNIEDKIKEYLDNWHKTGRLKTNGEMAHDIAEIVEKDSILLRMAVAALKAELNSLAELKDQLFRRNKRVEVLEQQLDNVKHLNRAEVEKIIRKILYIAESIFYYDEIDVIIKRIWNEVGEDIKKEITTICNLAIPRIKYLDRKNVIQILLSYRDRLIIKNKTPLLDDDLDDFITAICNLAIPEQKKLDKETIHELLNRFITFGKKGLPEAVTMDTVWNIEEAILSLAIQPIDKDKIIEILENHLIFKLKDRTLMKPLFKLIASEILTGEAGEEGKE